MIIRGGWLSGALFSFLLGIAAPSHAEHWHCIEGLGESTGERIRTPEEVLTVLESATAGIPTLVSAAELRRLALDVQDHRTTRQRIRPLWSALLTHRLQDDATLAPLITAAAALWGDNRTHLGQALNAVVSHPQAGSAVGTYALVLLGSAASLCKEPWAPQLWRDALRLDPTPPGITGAAQAMPSLINASDGMALLSTLVHNTGFHLKALEALNALIPQLTRTQADQAIAIIAERLKERQAPAALAPLDSVNVHYFLDGAYGLMTSPERAHWMDDLIHIADGGLATLPLLVHLRQIVSDLLLTRRIINQWTALRYVKVLERRAKEAVPSAEGFQDYYLSLKKGRLLDGEGLPSAEGPRPSGILRRIQ